MACATVAHSAAETTFCATLIANKCFDLCRSQRMTLAGFPDFKKAVSELKTTSPPPHPDYSVTIPLKDALVIKEALIEQWQGKSDFRGEMDKLLKAHNDVYNKRGLKRGSEVTGASAPEQPSKKLCVEGDPVDVDEFETKHTDR